MSDVAIRVENLGKRYRIGAEQARYKTLRESLVSGIKTLGKKSEADTTLWALKDVSFEVKQGEVIGVIGRNGAGKSTLLKVLAHITRPTTGKVEIHGRVGSLLEVGTGFHPELTGRDNIYLNGAILGMKRVEIDRKFDEIVAFAEIEKFLDTPAKHYSSGMYMRLAFAVAAHLEPEILLVDEVLAVGDAEFQKKCLGKMGEVAGEGRTVILVSHNMGSIRALCKRSFLLNQGSINSINDTEHVIRKYLQFTSRVLGKWVREPGKSKNEAYFQSISINNSEGMISDHFDCREAIEINILLCVETRIRAHIHVRFTNAEGIPVFTTASSDSTLPNIDLEPGNHNFSFTVPGYFLSPGRFSLIVAAIEPRIRAIDIIDSEISFFVEDTGYQNPLLRDSRLGVVNPILVWKKILLPKSD